MKMLEIPIKFHWSLFLEGPINNIQALVQIIGLAPNRRQAIIWTNDDPVQRHIYALLGLNELR